MPPIRTNLTVDEAVNKIRSAAKEHRLVLFIGAGVSRNAGYPDWKTLLNPVAEELGGWEALDGQTLPQVAQTYEHHHANRQPLRKLLRQQLAQNKEPSAVHLQLPALQPELIFTTNYDNLLQKTFPAARLVASPGAASDLERGELGIVHLHGHLDYLESGHDGLIITADDYMQVGKLKAPYFERLRNHWQNSLILFLGYGAGDLDVAMAGYTVRAMYGEQYAQRHLALDLSGRPDAALRTFWTPFCADVVQGAGLAGAHAGEKMLAFLRACAAGATPVSVVAAVATSAPLVAHSPPAPAPAPGPQAVVRAEQSSSSIPSLPGLTTQSDRYGFYLDLNIGGVVQRMRYIPPGEFLMGSPAGELERDDDEGPQHQVRISRGFWLADTACSQEFWLQIMGSNPSFFNGENEGGPQHPVEQISWYDVQAFLNKLDMQLPPACHAALPTEAEWEYACRAGTRTPFFFGGNISPQLVNYDGEEPYANGSQGLKRGCTVRVKELAVNAWGLYQMHGNVWEWCWDAPRQYSERQVTDPGHGPESMLYDDLSVRAVRGGSWLYSALSARSAFRGRSQAGNAVYGLGFRFALRPSSNTPVV